MTLRLSREEAREVLVGYAGLRAVVHAPGADGVRALLRQLRCIQLDPLDRVGTNADLVALARVDGVRRGEVYDHLLPGHAFEHHAKELCLLPPSAFPYYRDRAAEVEPEWVSRRRDRLPPGLVEQVYEAVASDGPLTAADLDHGAVRPFDYSGWKGTGRAASMALQVLWGSCRVVVAGRTPRGKRYDLPERALPEHHDAPATDFARWALLERVEAAGFLPRASGPWWGGLREARTSGLPEALLEDGVVMEVAVEGSRRTWLAPADLLARSYPEDDGRMRILGPLDPLLWDRKLVSQVFGFDYVWEVYKPATDRRWGYYVCPLLHRGRLVGRFEGHREEGRVVVDNLWHEDGAPFDEEAWREALNRLEEAQ